MPELPEVETTRRGLEPALRGRRLAEIRTGHPRLLRRQPHPPDFAARLLNRKVLRLGRKGKFLMFETDLGLTWVIHLGMSGRMSVRPAGTPEEKHTRLAVRTDRGEEIRMVDPRTFGWSAAYAPEELAASSLARLGPDALDELPPARSLAATAASRSIAVKTLLMDQRFLAGLGNIYADESLHRARIAPARPAFRVSPAEWGALRRGVGAALRDGLKYGGTSLSDLAYLLPDGRAGEYLKRLRAYGRTGLPCPRCGEPITRLRLAARSAHYCRACQK